MSTRRCTVTHIIIHNHMHLRLKYKYSYIQVDRYYIMYNVYITKKKKMFIYMIYHQQ